VSEVAEHSSASFPRWLVERDATLSGALTNPVFLAFELRRQQRGRALSGFRADPMGTVLPMLPYLMLPAAFVALVMGWPGSCCGLLFLGFIMWFASLYLRGQKREVSWVPPEFQDVIGDVVYVPILRELWLTPCRAEEYAEAVVLEGRQGNHILAAVVLALPWLCAIGIYIPLMISVHERLSLGDGLLIAAFTMLVVWLVKPLYWMLSVNAVNDATARLKVAGGSNLVDSSFAAIVSILTAVLYAFILGATVAVVTFIAVSLYSWVIAPVLDSAAGVADQGVLGRFVNDIASQNVTQVITALVLLAAMPIASLFARYLRNVYQQRMRALMTVAPDHIARLFNIVLERSGA